MRTSTIAVIVLALVAGTACASSDGPPDSLVVFAAASLAGVFDQLEAEFEASTGVDVVVNVAGSSSLREQILDGAPVDVFASANESVMADVVAAERVAESPVAFASNRLVVAVPAGNPAAVVGVADLGRDDLLIGLCAAGVPCGDLARAVLADAGVDPAPDTEEPDVRALSAKVAADDLDVGLVYATDAAASDLIDVVGEPVGPAARYPVAILDDAPNAAPAADFVAFLLSERGREILTEFGFEAP